MATLAFDTLQFARKLTSAGVPQAQAEAQAEAMGEAFGFYVDNLVTKDYLDSRLDAMEARLEQKFEQRFSAQDSVLEHFKGELKLQRWILAAVAASTVIPALARLFGWA